ncbi:MAG: PadR family transcriptional regulator [Miniphocaeibacter sp.]|uniref:PadR family transcriptional regulator n=1 Tax=Miniphocaeibacter sp. TaxID=3100973 RepID=UPI001844C7FC|nr:PadR family transcriptional regulator [Gallicola sp.]
MIKLLILNLLEIQPMSVYDIKSNIEKYDAMRWANILVGSIQNAVNSLYKTGEIEIDTVQYIGKRKKTIYKITEYGMQIRKKETQEAIELEDIQFSYNFFIGMSGAKTFNADQKRNMLNVRREKLIKSKISLIESIGIKKNHTTLDKVQSLVIDNMLNTIDGQILLVDKLIKNLGDNNEN